MDICYGVMMTKKYELHHAYDTNYSEFQILHIQPLTVYGQSVSVWSGNT